MKRVFVKDKHSEILEKVHMFPAEPVSEVLLRTNQWLEALHKDVSKQNIFLEREAFAMEKIVMVLDVFIREYKSRVLVLDKGPEADYD